MEAENRGELDSSISYFAHDAFWDASRTVGERFEGAADSQTHPSCWRMKPVAPAGRILAYDGEYETIANIETSVKRELNILVGPEPVLPKAANRPPSPVSTRRPRPRVRQQCLSRALRHEALLRRTVRELLGGARG